MYVFIRFDFETNDILFAFSNQCIHFFLRHG